MKGTVFSGIVHWPLHPDADIHGNLRVVIRTRFRMSVGDRLKHHGVKLPDAFWQAGIWHESRSEVEHRATEGHYGEILTCPLTKAYLVPENYRPLMRPSKAPQPNPTGTAPNPDLPCQAYKTG